jgi:hypothetical protein
LRVETPERKVVNFRFYDPRVLRAFLPACDRMEIAEFFGPIRVFVIEAEELGDAVRFTPDRPRVKQETLRFPTLAGER